MHPLYEQANKLSKEVYEAAADEPAARPRHQLCRHAVW